MKRMNATDQTLNAQGLNCPLPILRTRTALDAMNTGQTLAVIATDRGVVKDMRAFCQQTGHDLIATHEEAMNTPSLFAKRNQLPRPENIDEMQ